MKERPILFSGPMVRAILEGRKTQTRRVMKLPKWTHPGDSGEDIEGDSPAVCHRDSGCLVDVSCPYGAAGDRFWVKETGWQRPERTPRMMREGADTWAPYYFDADGLTASDHEQFKEWRFKRRPSIYMPRWASRITLEIESVRVERLQEISEADALAEGVIIPEKRTVEVWADHPARWSYKQLWDSITAGRGFGWARNPWVWVITFKKLP